MTYSKLITATALIGALTLAGVPVSAAQRGGGSRGGGGNRGGGGQSVGRPGGGQPRGGGGTPGAGRAVPRTGGVPGRGISPRSGVPNRPYYYRPGFRSGIGLGYYGYGFGYYGYPYGGYGYPYGYSGYGLYGYPYGYPYGYGALPPGYAMAERDAYGSVRIVDAPKDAEVYSDGYYVGIVEDFDGPIQHLKLEPGPHQIEIRAEGHPPLVFDVKVEPGQTITYHAEMRR